MGRARIAVNVVAPGAVATDFSGGIVRDDPEVNKHVAEATALGRAGLPDDIGPMIASLLSEENQWINAQRIEVSGGIRPFRHYFRQGRTGYPVDGAVCNGKDGLSPLTTQPKL